ncbi:type ISP restriction/modification enzyme [Arenicellales bacterium IMCC55707]
MADISDKDVERLRSIKSLPSLIKYLRDELGWDVPTDDIEALTFDYSPEELGIDPKTAAKIQEIKRLRPLSPQQPWGIFFVKFEPKRLPVVVLRKILANVAIKKRASSRKSDQASWDCDDLLFVSNYGEGEDRQISFAHFSQDVDRKRPPVLKVLGWDSQNTNLRYQETIRSLREKLSWREEYAKNIELWRQDWRSAFKLKHRQTINDSKKLASQLAELARSIRREINEVLAIETEKGSLRQIMESFRESLIHDIDEDQFADMYAQTISYGLLSSRMVDPEAKGTDDFASHMRTNPFLRELMETFIEVGGRKKKGKATIDFDDLGVNDVIEMLDDVDMKAVLLDFGDQNPQEDPVIHFFEGFLQEYDKKAKKEKGVFYTPRPVVSFIVRSVDELLRTEFGLEDGLADTTTWGEMAGRIDDLEIPDGATPDQAFVQILDPATGTGTFLVEVIDLIHKTMTSKWQAEGHGKKKIEKLWNAYVPEHLLPRLHGYELMMAPYAIAHMKIGLKLYETGYRFESDERARVYLTNALEPAQDFSGTLDFAIPALAHEAEAVNAIKRDQRFTAVIGNPPYSVMSGNLSEDARRLIDPYRYVDGEKIRERSMLRLEMHLQDDYVKFLALCQSILKKSSEGTFGLITNNGYLDNLTLRGVRNAIVQQFETIRLLNLHGNRLRANRQSNIVDENVFEIEQGVAITAASTRVNFSSDSEIGYQSLRGRSANKYDLLSANSFHSLELDSLNPTPEEYFLIPRDTSLEKEFKAFTSLTAIMRENISGIVTAHDRLVVDFDHERLTDNARILRDRSIDDETARAALQVKDNAGWKLAKARRKMDDGEADSDFLKPYAYRPFDTRTIYYHSALVWSDRRKVMSHVLAGENIALATCRQLANGPWEHVFVTRFLQDDCFVSNRTRERSYHFPLFLKGLAGRKMAGAELPFFEGSAAPNISSSYLDRLDLLAGTQSERTTLEDSFSFIYAILHSPQYRSRYEQFLSTDFPRLPVPINASLFSKLAQCGCELLGLHLLESGVLDSPVTSTVGAMDSQVEKVSYSDETVWIDKAKTRGFKGVPEEVWNFHIGGYQVCEKWLKDRQAKGGKNPRPGRVLTEEDIEHYQKIVVALSETIRIMAEIDEVIEAHGGWPGAFQTGEVSESADQPDPEDSQASLL